MKKASVIANKNYHIASIDSRIYGSFLEHLGRAVYTGIYEPDHPTADDNGMRRDVIGLVRELDTPVCRYPGGNFVSAYNWEDGIGPKDKRPTRLDLAWHTLEDNHVGIHEFANWCESVNTELMLAVNLGSRGLDAARNLLEYCNPPGGTAWSDLRIANGRKKPWDIKLWCLGNEMDGDWQVGHKTADEYGMLAANTARAMKLYDKTIELVVCGSCGSEMPTFPEWDVTVLEHTYDLVNYISLHSYFRNPEKHTGNFLALNHRVEEYIDTVAGVIAYVKEKKGSDHDVYISFDEWNVWYHSNEESKKFLDGSQGWVHAPSLLEDIYNFEDVLQVGCILNSFIRRSNIVKIACIAQLVNVIAPIMTEKAGKAWRQTIYYPLQLASKYGRGKALQLKTSSPSYNAKVGDNIPFLDIAGVDNEDGVITFFAINRNGKENLDIDISLEGFKNPKIIGHTTIHNDDIEAVNTVNDPEKVIPVKGTGAKIESGKVYASFEPYSYHILRVETN
jgi:alpha-N-arabinofuranosidase